MKKSIRLSFLEKLAIILMIFASGSLASTEFAFVRYGLLITLVLYFCLNGGMKIKSSLAIALLFFFSLWFIQYLFFSINDVGFDIIIKHYLIIFVSILFASSHSQNNKARVTYFVNVIIILSIISNALFFLEVFGINISDSPLRYIQHSNLFFLGIGGLRTAGIFWEPGLYQIFLNFAFIFVLFFEKKKKKKLLLSLYLTFSVFATGSVTGYLLFGTILLLYLLLGIKKPILKIALISLFVAIIILSASQILSIAEEKMSTGSYESRMNDLLIGLRVFLKHPVFGYGIENNAYRNESIAILNVDRGNSNGLINLLISLGLFGSFLYFYLFYRFSKCLAKWFSKKVVLPLFAWLILSLLNEPIFPFSFLAFFLGIGYSSLADKRFVLTKAQLNVAEIGK